MDFREAVAVVEKLEAQYSALGEIRKVLNLAESAKREGLDGEKRLVRFQAELKSVKGIIDERRGELARIEQQNTDRLNALDSLYSEKAELLQQQHKKHMGEHREKEREQEDIAKARSVEMRKAAREHQVKEAALDVRHADKLNRMEQLYQEKRKEHTDQMRAIKKEADEAATSLSEVKKELSNLRKKIGRM